MSDSQFSFYPTSFSNISPNSMFGLEMSSLTPRIIKKREEEEDDDIKISFTPKSSGVTTFPGSLGSFGGGSFSGAGSTSKW